MLKEAKEKRQKELQDMERRKALDRSRQEVFKMDVTSKLEKEMKIELKKKRKAFLSNVQKMDAILGKIDEARNEN